MSITIILLLFSSHRVQYSRNVSLGLIVLCEYRRFDSLISWFIVYCKVQTFHSTLPCYCKWTFSVYFVYVALSRASFNYIYDLLGQTDRQFAVFFKLFVEKFFKTSFSSPIEFTKLVFHNHGVYKAGSRWLFSVRMQYFTVVYLIRMNNCPCRCRQMLLLVFVVIFAASRYTQSAVMKS